MPIYLRLLLWLLLTSAAPVQAQELKLACADWSPFVDKTLEDGGPVMEIVREAFAHQNITSSVMIMPWARVLRIAERGAINVVVVCSWHTPERAEKFMFSQPFLINRISFLKNKQTHLQWQKLEDLKGLSFAVERQASYGKMFDQADYLTRYEVSSMEHQVRMVVNKRVDAAPINEGTALHYLTHRYPEQKTFVDFSSQSLQQSNLHIMVSRKLKGHKGIIEAFNSGLAQIKNNGVYRRILEKAGVYSLRYPAPAIE